MNSVAIAGFGPVSLPRPGGGRNGAVSRGRASAARADHAIEGRLCFLTSYVLRSASAKTSSSVLPGGNPLSPTLIARGNLSPQSQLRGPWNPPNSATSRRIEASQESVGGPGRVLVKTGPSGACAHAGRRRSRPPRWHRLRFGSAQAPRACCTQTGSRTCFGERLTPRARSKSEIARRMQTRMPLRRNGRALDSETSNGAA